jgi:hypothetical protein
VATEIKSSIRAAARPIVLLLSSLLWALSCQPELSEPTGGETHFLTHCEPSSGSTAGSCGSELACVYGVCSVPCSERATCQAFTAATCVASPGAASSESQALGYCDVTCISDADCAVVSALHRCEDGACRAGSAPIVGDPSLGSGGVAAGGAAGEAETSACVRGEVSANQVLLLGDSFFATSHQVAAYLEDFARAAGVLMAGERYRDDSRLTANALALGGNGIADQYASAMADSEARVVIMNGGGADVLLGSCDVVDASCPTLVAAAAAANDLFSKMAADGILHVVYVFYPDPVDANVRAKMDALRPLIQSACENAPVTCHWLDLRAAFAGRYAEYIEPDGRNPTAAGAQATAGAIWPIMQQHCVAQ